MIIPGEITRYGDVELFFGTRHDTIDESSPNNKFLNQDHSGKAFLLIDKNHKTSDLKVDAIVTTLNDINLCIRSADCTPILVYDKYNDIIAAIHAGWRGAASEIIQNTINLMETIGANPATIHVFIGPCIRRHSYEVSVEVLQIFGEAGKKFFKKYRDGKLLFDLPGYCKYILCNLGINMDSIIDTSLDTFLYPDLFYSYRFYQKNKLELQKGQRQISMIKLIKS
jgi:YfiH family protein